MKTWKKWTLVSVLVILAFAVALVACDNGNKTHSHDSGAWRTVLEPNCETTGTKELRCNSCNEVLDTSIIEALGHNLQPTANITKQPDCENNGVGDLVCTRCDRIEIDGVIKALGHLYSEWTAPTCTETGNSSRTCTRTDCGNEEIRTTGFAALGHDHFESLICNRTGCDHQYAIGDTGEGGGKIFYVSIEGFTMSDNSTTAHYLEAAPNDMESTLAWSSNSFISTDILGTTRYIGTGRENTSIILATDTTAPAAIACRNYNGGSLNDWFLPSKDELNELYENKSAAGINNFDFFGVMDWYSSSSQAHPSGIWYQRFSNGADGLVGKESNIYVRAIRAF